MYRGITNVSIEIPLITYWNTGRFSGRGAQWVRALLVVGLLACRARPVATPPAPAPDIVMVAARPPRPAGCLTDAAAAGQQQARLPAATMSYRGAEWLTRPERIAEEDPERLIAALHLRPGMVVADIGAGVGYHTWRMAPLVAPNGRIVATDIQPQMLADLERNVRARGLANVSTALSGDGETGLPSDAIDLALMVDVYHELSQPARFLADLRRALRPQGRLALVEFRAEDPKVPIRPEHRMTAAQATAEMAAAGFCLVGRDDTLPWQHLLVFEPLRH